MLPVFVEETATSGITTAYTGDWQYMVGGGAAVFDCDADDRLDVFVAGGEGPDPDREDRVMLVRSRTSCLDRP